MPATAEQSDLVISSKTQTPEQINEVLKDLGYDVSAVEEESQQQTPEEVAASETAKQAEETAKAEKAEQEAAAAVEHEKTTRNERRRLARERDQKQRDEAIARADRVERELSELKAANAATVAQVEELRKNPPKAPPPEPELVAPKRPARADYFDKEDPDTAYEDAMLDYGDQRREYNRLVEERKKPKPEAAKESAPVEKPVAPAATNAGDLSEAIAKEKNPVQKRFLQAVDAIAKKVPDAVKLISDNAANFSEPMFSAVHVFDDPARIALYLAQHPEESKRIKALTDGAVSEDPRRIRIATRELEKIEKLAADEDAAAATAKSGSENSDDEDDGSQDESDGDLSAATVSPQPQRPAAASQPAPAAAAAAAPASTPHKPRKPTPVEPVGARGAQTPKRYEEMTADEMRQLSPDDVRKMRGML